MLEVARICAAECKKKHSHARDQRTQIPAPDAREEVALLFKLPALELEATGKPCILRKGPPGAFGQKVPDHVEDPRDDQAEADPCEQVPSPPELKAEENYQCNCRNVLAHIPPVNPTLKRSCTHSNLIDGHANSLGWLTLPKLLQTAILRRFIPHLALPPETCISGLV